MVKDKGPSSSFLKVKCAKCKNEQVIFDKSSTEIKCLVCSKEIAKPTGGKSHLTAKVIESLN